MQKIGVGKKEIFPIWQTMHQFGEHLEQKSGLNLQY
jgi:hypothetical protein